MATEKRLIIPSELIAEIEILYQKHYVHSYDKTVHDIFNAIRRRIWKCATVDAVEVVHGQWEDVYGGKYQNKRFRCSICKEKALFKFSQDELLSWHEEQKLSNYCPNCGADMRERKDNG